MWTGQVPFVKTILKLCLDAKPDLKNKETHLSEGNKNILNAKTIFYNPARTSYFIVNEISRTKGKLPKVD